MAAETVFASGFTPDPARALDVLAFVLCPPEVFAPTGDPDEIAAVAELIEPAKAEAVRRWHALHAIELAQNRSPDRERVGDPDRERDRDPEQDRDRDPERDPERDRDRDPERDRDRAAAARLNSLLNMPAKLSTHVLDTAHGCPAQGMKIELWSIDGEDRTLVTTAKTNADGRTDTPLLTADEMKAGLYEIVFFDGDYFIARATPMPKLRFLDHVPVRFGIADAGASYHVPLLCSPWSYSTYRGS